jgi:hypothetical protein
MSPDADLTYFCKRCRATQVKRCRCPLPTIGTDHNWDADAAYHLWPNALEELVGAATNWDGTPITLRDLLQRARK